MSYSCGTLVICILSNLVRLYYLFRSEFMSNGRHNSVLPGIHLLVILNDTLVVLVLNVL